MHNAARGSANARDGHGHIMSNWVQGAGGHPHFPTHLIRPFHLPPPCSLDGSVKPRQRLGPGAVRGTEQQTAAAAHCCTKRLGPGAVRGAAQQTAAAAHKEGVHKASSAVQGFAGLIIFTFLVFLWHTMAQAASTASDESKCPVRRKQAAQGNAVPALHVVVLVVLLITLLAPSPGEAFTSCGLAWRPRAEVPTAPERPRALAGSAHRPCWRQACIVLRAADDGAEVRMCGRTDALRALACLLFVFSAAPAHSQRLRVCALSVRAW
jgi:hypothetical protein